MQHLKIFLSWIFIVVISFACTPPEDKVSEKVEIIPDPDNGGIVLTKGFGAMVVADLPVGIRQLTVASNGDVFAKATGKKVEETDMSIIGLRDTTADGKADIIYGFDNYQGRGIKLHGDFLYASSDSVVYRYPMTEGNLRPTGTRETLITFPKPEAHGAKTFTFDGEGNIYVNVGAWSNACQEPDRRPGVPGQDPCPQLEYSGGIWRFPLETTNQSQKADGYRYATGIRNAVAIAWNDNVNTLYAVQHGRDQLHYIDTADFTKKEEIELPAEEFLRVNDGDDFGWPYCYYDHFKNEKMLAPEYGGDGEIQGRCENIEDPVMAFPAHWGPNDLVFYTGDQFPEKYRNGAFIAFHGSWNRAPEFQEGYNVVFVPMTDGEPTGDYEVFASEFVGDDPVKSPGKAEYRPCGLAVGPDGSLYISDSKKGRIWRVMYYGDNLPVSSQIEE